MVKFKKGRVSDCDLSEKRGELYRGPSTRGKYASLVDCFLLLQFDLNLLRAGSWPLPSLHVCGEELKKNIGIRKG
jgi:hypothetical protein